MVSLLRIVTIVLVAFVSYQVYQIPIPEAASQPIRLRTFLAINKLAGHVVSVLTTLGVTTEVEAKRFLLNVASRKREEHVQIQDSTFDGVPVRIYTPLDAKGDLPGMVYYHGGGWIIGNVDSYNAVTSFFAREGNMVVISVDYRLNPEFSTADGLEDCVKATKHFIRHAAKYSVDSNRVCVGGDSAGANYAAAVALKLRDEHFSPMPKIQLLIYPSVQVLDLQLPSYQQNVNGPLYDRRSLAWTRSILFAKNTDLIDEFASNTHVIRDVREKMAASLLNVDLLPKEMLYPPYKRPVFEEGNKELWLKIKDRCFDPYAYPLMAKDHSNLPKTYMFTGQYDQLRDDGLLYVRKLREAGVDVAHYNCPYGWHGMINFHTFLQDSKQVMTGFVDYLRENL